MSDFYNFRFLCWEKKSVSHFCKETTFESKEFSRYLIHLFLEKSIMGIQTVSLNVMNPWPIKVNQKVATAINQCTYLPHIFSLLIKSLINF